MLSLVRGYADRAVADWGPLFQCCLQSRINDWHRRSTVRNRLRAFLRFGDDEDEDGDGLDRLPDPAAVDPARQLAGGQAMSALDRALRALPLRQRQAFLLRAWEGLDVGQTAAAMQCSEGSVKTHYFRALNGLRAELGGHWP
jgi:RNA polymerase sigma-70 factor (ECF subfamily)